MAEIGKLYYLAKDPFISSYAMNDTYDIGKKKITQWIPAKKLEEPFMIVEEYRKHDNYWVKVVIEDKSGWIHIDEEQLRLYKPYR